MAETALSKGTILRDKWRIDAKIAAGGVATVYSATHRNGHRVAIKVLHADFAQNLDVCARFRQEGYAANQIQHVGVVRVLDDDTTAEGRPFLVMELLEGESVEEKRLRLGGKLSVSEVTKVALDALSVLDAAHAKGIVHRDIKPDNLYLTRDGSVKVLDFGIARMREALLSEATRTGTLLGTAEFMPPEQASGRSNEIDAQSDIWAVGATMFILLTGQPVHPGDGIAEILKKAATIPAPPIAFLGADLPETLAAVVDKALGFAKAARWASASAMRDALVRASKVDDARIESTMVSPKEATPSVRVAPKGIPIIGEDENIGNDATVAAPLSADLTGTHTNKFVSKAPGAPKASVPPRPTGPPRPANAPLLGKSSVAPPLAKAAIPAPNADLDSLDDMEATKVRNEDDEGPTQIFASEPDEELTNVRSPPSEEPPEDKTQVQAPFATNAPDVQAHGLTHGSGSAPAGFSFPVRGPLPSGPGPQTPVPARLPFGEIGSTIRMEQRSQHTELMPLTLEWFMALPNSTRLAIGIGIGLVGILWLAALFRLIHHVVG